MNLAEPEVEVLFSHAYLVSESPHPLTWMHPLPPLQPASLASWLRQEAGAKVATWDSTFRVSVDSFDVAVSRMRPRLCWIHTHPTTRVTALEMVGMARRAGATVAAGGPDAGLRPGEYLRAGADAVVPGEGEAAMLDLLLGLRAGAYRLSSDLLKRVAGILYLDEQGEVRKSTGVVRPVPLDSLPAPARDVEQTRVQLERWSQLGRSRTLAISSARGCPVDCGFCTRSVFSRPYRRRRPSAVVDEMAELVDRFDPACLRFVDEVFLFDSHWLREFVDELVHRKLKVAFAASAHPSALDVRLLPSLVEAGLEQIDLQASSGSSGVLRRLGWSHDPSDVYRCSTAIRAAGLDVTLKVLVGLPGETPGDLQATMEMVRLVQPTGVEVTRIDPGSPALFRRDWERVVAGPLTEHPQASEVPSTIALSAAIAWMHSAGSVDRQRGFAVEQLDRLVQRPILRALVRLHPSLPLGAGRSSRWRRTALVDERLTARLAEGPGREEEEA